MPPGRFGVVPEIIVEEFVIDDENEEKFWEH